MTWIHCDARNGDVVTCSEDSAFGVDNASDTMRKQFVSIYTDMTIDEARAYTRAKFDRAGRVISKNSYNVDLTAVVPAAERDNITDREAKVDLVETKLDPNLITAIGVR